MFEVRALVDGSRTVRANPAQVTVGKHIEGSGVWEVDQAVVAFPRLPQVSSECVRRAVLRLPVTATTGGGVELSVYPSADFKLARGDQAGARDAGALLDNRPRGHLDTVTAGTADVDVTDLYRTWVGGGVFPSGKYTAPASGPVVLTVQPSDQTNGSYSARISTVGIQLSVTEANCGTT